MSEQTRRIDLETYRVLKTPALVGPKDEINYHEPAVQEVIGEIFGYLLPKVEKSEAGDYYFTCPDSRGGDLCDQIEEVRDVAEIPRDELAALMGAWFAIRRLGNDSKLDTRIKAILRNFRFPDPKRALHLYKLSTDVEGVKRLHIWWGIEPIEGRNPTTDGATAFSKLLRCNVSDVEQRWKEYSQQTRKQLVMPGNATSPVYIDPVTRAVQVLSQTGAVKIDPASGRVQLPTSTVPVETQPSGGFFSRLDPVILMLIIIGIGAVILAAIFLLP